MHVYMYIYIYKHICIDLVVVLQPHGPLEDDLPVSVINDYH